MNFIEILIHSENGTYVRRIYGSSAMATVEITIEEFDEWAREHKEIFHG